MSAAVEIAARVQVKRFRILAIQCAGEVVKAGVHPAVFRGREFEDGSIVEPAAGSTAPAGPVRLGSAGEFLVVPSVVWSD